MTLLRAFLWIYLKAAVWVALTALALYRGTGQAKVARAYIFAHIAALGFSALIDAFFWVLAPKSWLVLDVLQWVVAAPIAIFMGIALWISSWEAPVGWRETFMMLVPIVAWGILIMYGFRWHILRDPRIYTCNVLGAWFVCAASGAVDLWTRFGPSWARRWSYLARLTGYAVVITAVVLFLPSTM